MIVTQWMPQPTPYLETWTAMRDFTETRSPDAPDQIWLAEHSPVYTLGQAGKPEHVLNQNGIELLQTDRGGQVTYHGPGQVVAYCMVDLRRRGLYVKEYVALLEDVAIAFLQGVGLTEACRKSDAPGVYIPLDGELAKIGALGIKVRKNCTYHGLALNVDMDLDPFLGINPCGYAGLRTVDLKTCGVSRTVRQVGDALAHGLRQALDDLGRRTSPAD
jgi:lipoyl(octanoyl) transferase